MMYDQFPGDLYKASPETPATGRALRAAFVSGEMRRLLERILDDREAMSECAQRSFPHPLGFLKIVLVAFPNGSKLRLHVWPADRNSDINPDIHDHFWDFSSIVLTGQMEFVDFTQSECGDNFYHYRLFPTGVGEYRQVYLGRSGLSADSVHRIKRGGFLSVNRATLHRAQPAGHGLCATLLLQGPQLGPCNNIYSSTHQRGANKIVAELPLSTGEVEELLRQVVSFLPSRY
jgi:hypothetical protein